jgi:DNA-binding MarR family transcriptional regulator
MLKQFLIRTVLKRTKAEAEEMDPIHAQWIQFYHQFGKFYTKQFAPILAETGLSMREIHVLLFLANNPEFDTARDVSLYRRISKSQVSEAVELLVGRGLLCRTSDAADRRVTHLAITAEGLPLVNRAQEVQSDCVQQMLDGLTLKENEQLRAVLKKLFANGKRLAEGESSK